MTYEQLMQLPRSEIIELFPSLEDAFIEVDIAISESCIPANEYMVLASRLGAGESIRDLQQAIERAIADYRISVRPDKSRFHRFNEEESKYE